MNRIEACKCQQELCNGINSLLLKSHNVNSTMLVADLMLCSLHNFNQNLWKVFEKYKIPTNMRNEDNFKFSKEIVDKVYDKDERKNIGDKVKQLRELSAIFACLADSFEIVDKCVNKEVVNVKK